MPWFQNKGVLPEVSDLMDILSVPEVSDIVCRLNFFKKFKNICRCYKTVYL